ncbi:MULTISPECIES: Rid family detoxifying hydrolase [unclassified Campylobacter]|uniref:Rid family detoxifying hydrolase n=1 Tax=unclassified Campylobacter TaxID=2593542 RepID=UPI001237B2A1|nr:MULTISPECIES: Rid family detoxifying hydrolase [unclassified Campylobacter]KAA6224571.1 RidA family protein [Campylobacter sp. LR185c]KAA6224918.1 RidA family protein [Campylobacter sp. LR196d]KAA6225415.1 RidA family protein [Campylobacter sp. LR286c]KAA6229119.1 RidA family protein [Campylobacter sp. LR291e]KAA6229603.1 RidA family protein [Campylobacter sp. LR264d]
MNYPKAIGAYSVYRKANGFLFASGQIPLNPATNTIETSDIKGQTKQVLENIKGILDENNLGFEDIIKTTCFLADIADFKDFNEVYSSFFNAPYPARSAVAVKDLPKNAKIEIEIIAFKA